MRYVLALSAILASTGCASLMQQSRTPGMPGADAKISPPAQTPREVPMAILPLPGGLDQTLVFNSNSPEELTQGGIALSTFPQHLNRTFTGRFTVFAHHIAKDATPGARLLHLGLLAKNPGTRPVTLVREAGASYVSQPDALFVPLAAVIPDPDGQVYAGPGDRVVTDLIHGRSPLAPQTWTIPAGGMVLVYDLPIPTDVAILPPVNGRSALLRCVASGPVHLAEVGLFAERGANGSFLQPDQAAFERVLAAGVMAGPPDKAATPFDAHGKPVGPFRYGRVAGISQGDAWNGDLTDALAGLTAGQTSGFPIAGLYMNRLGTGQNQSAPMVARNPDTAYQAHGNYCVTYTLKATLRNPDAATRHYALRLSQPAKVLGEQPARAAVYLEPPGKPVFWRGPVKLTVDGVASFTHLTIRHGEEPAAFGSVAVPAGQATQVTVTIIYAPDATPPQLLSVSRLD